jgi:hypothetical protein
MEISKTLRRPSNWQDFETLCKKLWGEIWSCPEIKKNGREGQTQHGVDISGIPFGESEYYGIQCKGKDEYTNKQLTEDEITTEVEKAKLFTPPLKKLYFATTAAKDAKIEEFVRKKNLENKAKGLFEVHIFSWEDIVELIDENKQTHDYYLKSQNYKSVKSVLVTFQDELTEITVTPKFKRTITHFRQKIVPATSSISEFTSPMGSFLNTIIRQQEQFARISPVMVHARPSSIQINQSFCEIYFQIHNTGLEALEEYKLFFSFEGELQSMTDDNEVRNGIFALPIISQVSNVILFEEKKAGKVIPKKSILVGDDTFSSNYIYIKPLPKDYEIAVRWKLISKDFKDEGELKVVIKPDIETDYKDILVEDPLKVGIKEFPIEDVFVDKKQSK